MGRPGPVEAYLGEGEGVGDKGITDTRMNVPLSWTLILYERWNPSSRVIENLINFST